MLEIMFDCVEVCGFQMGLAHYTRRESIVTNMVRLKHGKDTIVSNKLVAEANISLSECRA